MPSEGNTSCWRFIKYMLLFLKIFGKVFIGISNPEADIININNVSSGTFKKFCTIFCNESVVIKSTGKIKHCSVIANNSTIYKKEAFDMYGTSIEHRNQSLIYSFKYQKHHKNYNLHTKIIFFKI